MQLKVTALDHLVVTVLDVAVSAAWYQAALGMQRAEFDPGEDQAPRVSLRFGAQKINLRPMSATMQDWFTGHSPTRGSQDLCFLTPLHPRQVVEHLQSCGIAIELGPVVKQGAQGTLMSVYCRDPDGNLIEVSSYA